jgi:hypothetical protein
MCQRGRTAASDSTGILTTRVANLFWRGLQGRRDRPCLAEAPLRTIDDPISADPRAPPALGPLKPARLECESTRAPQGGF